VPARNPGDFYAWWLTATGYSAHHATGVAVQCLKLGTVPTTTFKRLMGVWGTKPRERELMYQQQAGLKVQFDGDYAFDLSLDPSGGFNTNGVWKWVNAAGAWPPGYCCAVYFRGEAGRSDTGPKVCQVNVAAWCNPGTTDRRYVTQMKGLGIKDEAQSVSQDHVRCIIEPGASRFAVMVNDTSRAKLLVSGYELLPTP
jgi:hypothetical protein